MNVTVFILNDFEFVFIYSYQASFCLDYNLYPDWFDWCSFISSDTLFSGIFESTFVNNYSLCDVKCTPNFDKLYTFNNSKKTLPEYISVFNFKVDCIFRSNVFFLLHNINIVVV